MTNQRRSLTSACLLTREECLYYREKSEFGKKVTGTMPDLSFSAKRKIIIENAPEEAVTRFEQVAKEINLEDSVKQISINARTFGTGYFSVSITGKPIDRHVTIAEVQENDLRILPLDPILISGSETERDPESVKFMELKYIYVGGKKAHHTRAGYIYNTPPIYNLYTPANYAFGGLSVFENIADILEMMPTLREGIQRLISKGSLLMIQADRGSVASGLGEAEIEQTVANYLSTADNFGTLLLDRKHDAKFFGFEGASEVDTLFELIRKNINIGVHDTPASLMLDQSMANGLSEGSEDMKSVLMCLDSYRYTLIPVYKMADRYVMMKAWTPQFFATMQEKYPQEFAGKQYFETIYSWMSAFEFEFGNPYPETQLAKTTRHGLYMELLQSAKSLGANLEDIEKNLNEEGIFTNKLTLDENNIEQESNGWGFSSGGNNQEEEIEQSALQEAKEIEDHENKQSLDD